MTVQFQLKYPKNTFKHDRYYRLDLVYAVSIENDRYDSKYPYKVLKVMFSEFKDSYQDLNSIKTITEKDFFKSNKVLSAEKTAVLLKVDVTNHFLLEPGTVWKNGSVVWGLSQSKSVELIQNKEKPEIITYFDARKRGVKLSFLPPEVYFSNVVMVQNCIIDNNTVTLLIPTMEIIRYYYLGSNYLTMQLYNGGFQHLKGKSSPITFKYDALGSTRECYIWLRRKCYDSDAIIIARAIKSNIAWNAMKYIYSSINSDRKKSKKILYPKTFFPFDDSTELEVQGQWLAPDENMNFKYFFVRSIQKCHHELPFDKLIIESVDSYKGQGEANRIAGEGNQKLLKGMQNNNQDTPKLNYDSPPNEILDKNEIEFYQTRFKHLEQIVIEKVSRASELHKKRYETEELETIDDSTLPGNYQKNNYIQPWQTKIIDALLLPVSERLKIVSKSVYKLVKQNLITVKPLPEGYINDDKPFGLYSFSKPKDKPGNYKWHIVNDDIFRKRRALFLKLTETNQKQRSIFILEIEGKGGSIFSLFLMKNICSDSYMNDTKKGAKLFLQEIANRSGQKINSQVLSKNFDVITTMKHTDKDSFSDKLCRAILDFFKV